MGTTLQLHGITPHFFLCIYTFLDKKFPGIWMERRGLISWHPRSPQLTLDFFFWGVYKTLLIPKNAKFE
jgi:hypothetical protein